MQIKILSWKIPPVFYHCSPTCAYMVILTQQASFLSPIHISPDMYNSGGERFHHPKHGPLPPQIINTHRQLSLLWDITSPHQCYWTCLVCVSLTKGAVMFGATMGGCDLIGIFAISIHPSHWSKRQKKERKSGGLGLGLKRRSHSKLEKRPSSNNACLKIPYPSLRGGVITGNIPGTNPGWYPRENEGGTGVSHKLLGVIFLIGVDKNQWELQRDFMGTV